MTQNEEARADLGSAEDAIEFHLSGQADEPHSDFLRAWQQGDVSEWPEFQEFLAFSRSTDKPDAGGEVVELFDGIASRLRDIASGQHDIAQEGERTGFLDKHNRAHELGNSLDEIAGEIEDAARLATPAPVVRGEGEVERAAYERGIHDATIWLRDQQHKRPPETLWHAAAILADRMNATLLPVSATPAPDIDQLVEKMGEALFLMSAGLRAAGFLDEDSHHAAYEKTVAAWDALTAALSPQSTDLERMREALAATRADLVKLAWEENAEIIERIDAALSQGGSEK